MPSKLRQRVGLALVIGTLVVAIVVTQWPFEYRVSRYALEQHWRRIDWSVMPGRGTHQFGRDFVQNLLMLIPLGFGWGLWRTTTRGRMILESMLVGSATGLVLELAQLLTHERYTQLADVWRNALGCIVGCALAIVLQYGEVP